MKSSNKRKNRRQTCLVPITGKAGSAFDETQTIDISKGGMGIISSRRIPLNKEIAIELDLKEEGEPVLVLGQVKWVEPIVKSKQFRVGVYFKEILNGSKPRLKHYFSHSI